MPTSNHQWTSRELNLATWIIIVASICYTSMGFGLDNHAIELPLIKLLGNPSLYPGDPFAQALRLYPVPLWHLVAFMARVVPLKALLLGLFLCERVLLIFSIRRLARAIAPETVLGAIASMVVFVIGIRSLLGAGTIVEYYFEHSGLAIACLLFAMAAFLEHRPWAWSVWTALAFNATSLYGCFALSYFAAMAVTDRTYRAEWRRWIRPFAAFVALCIYGLVLSLRSLGTASVDKSQWLDASLIRSWWHAYPLEWERSLYLSAGAVLVMLAITLVVAGPRFQRFRRYGAVWSLVGAGWLLVAFVAAYVTKSPFMLRIQAARGTDLWICYATVTMVTMTGAMLEAHREPGSRRSTGHGEVATSADGLSGELA